MPKSITFGQPAAPGSLAGRFTGHLVGRHAAQFVVDQRQQFIGGLGITVFDGVEELRDVTHCLGRYW